MLAAARAERSPQSERMQAAHTGLHWLHRKRPAGGSVSDGALSAVSQRVNWLRTSHPRKGDDLTRSKQVLMTSLCKKNTEIAFKERVTTYFAERCVCIYYEMPPLYAVDELNFSRAIPLARCLRSHTDRTIDLSPGLLIATQHPIFGGNADTQFHSYLGHEEANSPDRALHEISS